MTAEVAQRTWGIWHFHPEQPGALMANQVYGIELTELAEGRDLARWIVHLSGKAWITTDDLADLARAWAEINHGVTWPEYATDTDGWAPDHD